MAMVKAGLSGLFDHGVAYRVSARLCGGKPASSRRSRGRPRFREHQLQ
jgi:hypothetical protein